MFPIVAIGTVIGAVASVIKGASWLKDHVSSAEDAGAAPEAGKPADGPGAAFQAALAAQGAGQVMPAAPAPGSTAGSGNGLLVIPQTHDTDYQSLAQMRAGLAAYQAADLRRSHDPDVAGP